MAENKHYYTAVVEEKRGASEKPLGRQVSKEEQKASGANSGTNPHPQASKSNQAS